MNAGSCPHETAVVTAIRTGFRSEALRAHAESCADCQEASRVVAVMAAVAETSGVREAPPDPSVAWLRAQLEQRQRLDASRLRRAFVVAAVAHLALVAGGLVVAASMWPALVGLVESLGLLTPVATAAMLISLAAVVMPAVAYVLLTRIPLRLSFHGGRR